MNLKFSNKKLNDSWLKYYFILVMSSKHFKNIAAPSIFRSFNNFLGKTGIVPVVYF